MDITLICWQCGKEQRCEADHVPGSSMELAGMTNVINWKSAVDVIRGRLLIFCSSSCMEKAKNKQGFFRLRPKHDKAT